MSTHPFGMVRVRAAAAHCGVSDDLVGDAALHVARLAELKCQGHAEDELLDRRGLCAAAHHGGRHWHDAVEEIEIFERRCGRPTVGRRSQVSAPSRLRQDCEAQSEVIKISSEVMRCAATTDEIRAPSCNQVSP